MKNAWNALQALIATIGGGLGWFFGEMDGFFLTLLVLVILDYLTGIMCAVSTKTLSSSAGFKGICRKVLIFFLVGVGHVLDVYVLGQAGVLRNAIIFFYLSNEGISLLENAGVLGLPIPEWLKDVLTQLNDKNDKEDK